jgi:hypothetical protein
VGERAVHAATVAVAAAGNKPGRLNRAPGRVVVGEGTTRAKEPTMTEPVKTRRPVLVAVVAALVVIGLIVLVIALAGGGGGGAADTGGGFGY